MQTIKVVLTLLTLSALTACGGGSSANGAGSLQKVATACVTEVVVSVSNFSIPLETRSYTNNCGFAVNLAIYSTITSNINAHVPLAENEVYTESILLEAHFACRAPAIPTRNGPVGNYENSCEG